MSSQARSALPGSESLPLQGGVSIGPVDPHERIEVSVMVRPRQPLADLDARLSQAQPYLSREEFAAAYGADPADVARVEDFARQYGLAVEESSEARRTVRLSGRAAETSKAFGVELVQYRLPDGSTVRTYQGSVSVPTQLHGIVQGVFGLDNRPIARRNPD